ncbi:TIGR03985 family CRISPR-associated protein [Calothrix sp. FACHB-1219]|uniref:TIGR03985 family CRISPR-associated protein n=1 Tax=unclassified Calothrix TaxID=2619626 RepID=UPI001684BDE3|nr:TIGR03985 family CRISPR-associated protein [Calothrix sp. FACHB-168]MBD2222676.1 TIGR03985 family CRISPR-associated protein [Calothrix sp. FACHB-1219]
MVQIFSDVPQVELLQWLARGSLKQNLLRAIRLWVWLRSLYGETSDRLLLDDSFTFAGWRDAFFSSTHPKTDVIPQLHDVNCVCAKTTAEWLFNSKTGISQSQWKRSLLTHLSISHSVGETKPSVAKNPCSLKSESDLDELLKRRLFAVTRRSLQADLEILEELGWLKYQQQQYHRVSNLPFRPMTTNIEVASTKINSHELNFVNQEDLAAIAQNLSQKIGGIQRFFFKLDYVIPRTTIDSVDDWQHKLREIWGQIPVPAIIINYNSARLGKYVECFVYPVCIYYVQRAVYLCAFGESPDRNHDWYNFRLDRIENITPIAWTNSAIPKVLQQRYQKADLPRPEEIEAQMSKAWGFDFYLEPRLMLLRFEKEYHERYIRNTFRHDTFKAIAYSQAERLIKQNTPPSQQQELLKILAARSCDDAYYRVYYRHGDNNVSMRLRAWRPKVEVIMPWDLRQSIAADVSKEFHLYYY